MLKTTGYFQFYTSEERKILPEFVDLSKYRYPSDYSTIGKVLTHEGHKLVILRAGTQSQNANTSSTDDEFTTTKVNYYRDAGIKVGTYYYARHINTYTTNGGWSEANAVIDAESHANNYADILEGVLGAGDCGDIIPCIDFEDNRIYDDGAYVTTAQILYVWLKAFNDRMKVRFPDLNGCMLYTAYYYIDACSSTHDIRHSVDGGIANIYPYLWYSANALYTGIHSGGTSTYPNYNFTNFGDYTLWTLWQYSTDRNALCKEFLYMSDTTTSIDMNIFDSINYNLSDIEVYPETITPKGIEQLRDKAKSEHTHKGDYLPLQYGTLTGKTSIVNPDALILKQEENKSWKLARTSTSTSSSHVAGDISLTPSTDYYSITNGTHGETWQSNKIVFKPTPSIEISGSEVPTVASNSTITGNWNFSNTLQQGGNNVLTTASIISDVTSLNAQAYETSMTNAVDGVIDVKTLNGLSAFNQVSDPVFNDVANWNTSLTNVTTITDPSYSNSMQITATAGSGMHYTDRSQSTKDTVPLQNGRQYFILVKFNIRSFTRLKFTMVVKNAGGTYDTYTSNIPAGTTNDWLYLKTPVLSVNATPDNSFRFYLMDGGNNETWTASGTELVSITEPKIIDITACGLTSYTDLQLLEMFKQAPQFGYRQHVNNLTLTTLNNAKTTSSSVSLDQIGVTSLKSLSSTIYDTYNDDTKLLTRKVSTASGLSNTATINSSTCIGIKTGGLFFAYNSQGEYTYGTEGTTLAFTNPNVTVDYEIGTTVTFNIPYGINLPSYTNGYFRLSGSIIPYTTINYPRNLAGAVNTQTTAIMVNDSNIKQISDSLVSRRLVAKKTAGNEYIRIARIKMTGANAYARLLYNVDITHTGTYLKVGKMIFYFYKVNGYGSLNVASYARLINNSDAPNPWVSGDLVCQNWIPSNGTTGFTDVYLMLNEYASIYCTPQHYATENNLTSGITSLELLPSGDTLLSSVPSTSATMIIEGVTYTAEASVNSTIKSVTMT